MKKVYILSARRTAIGKFMGSLATIPPTQLAATVIKAILQETKVDPARIDEVIFGNVLSAGQKQGVARQASMLGGVPAEVPAYSINMLCASGMKSILNAFTAIRSGEANLVLAGGTESMSGAGFILDGSIRQGHKMGDMTMMDHMAVDGLTDAFDGIHMGAITENIVERYHITREEQDNFSWLSQQKAIAAVDSGRFIDEIIPVTVETKKSSFAFDTDEFPNRSTSLEKMATLKPAFKKGGTVTAGNASGINDGASCLLLASEEMVKELGLQPMAELVAVGQAGVDPKFMGMGPVPAIRKMLQKTEYKLADMELIELNEAFAAQSLAVLKTLCEEHSVSRDWIGERTNVNGGALALGHPIGSSGNRIVVTLLHEMKRRHLHTGLASLCVGGGMGASVLIRI